VRAAAEIAQAGHVRAYAHATNYYPPVATLLRETLELAILYLEVVVVLAEMATLQVFPLQELDHLQELPQRPFAVYYTMASIFSSILERRLFWGTCVW
jgi:hypothetical protein